MTTIISAALPGQRTESDERRVRVLLELAEHWSEHPCQTVQDAAANLLPSTPAIAAWDYVSESSDHLIAAHAIREGDYDKALVYLHDEDLPLLPTEAQRITAAYEAADCEARAVLVRAVAADNATALGSAA